jgi:lysine 6-dehydrogenase
VGTLEAFNSDGLRTLASYPIPNMKEKTMRYPGHAELMKVLRDTGFFSKEEIEVRGMRLRPLDLTARLLFPAWKLPEGEEDISVMRVIIEGKQDGASFRYTYSLLDRYHPATRTTSMARTTGYTCAVAARIVMDGIFQRKGVCPPEYLGRELPSYQALMSGLARRNILFLEHVEML